MSKPKLQTFGDRFAAREVIAQDPGYADVRTFTVMFRRAFGSTSQQFRQRFRV
ncbi:hypothetical protein [Paraburkholderia sp.]|uniref:hypothetical protein n=1 Tax=Paraburkholderia sp. TaxID=1926495 RepID=UPI0039E3DA79